MTDEIGDCQLTRKREEEEVDGGDRPVVEVGREEDGDRILQPS